MDRRKVILHWDDIKLATLSRKRSKYLLQYTNKGLAKALDAGCPEFIHGCKEGVWDELPPIFLDFEISKSRTDLLEKLGIEKGDSKFDRLYKHAQKCDLFIKNGFWISAEE